MKGGKIDCLSEPLSAKADGKAESASYANDFTVRSTIFLIHRDTESPRNHLRNIWVSVLSGPGRRVPPAGDVSTSVREPLAAECRDLSCST